MAPIKCKVKGCINDPKWSRRFSFPSDKRREEWIRACGQKLPFDGRNARICAYHFEPKDFETYNGRTMLRIDAVPTKNLPSTDLSGKQNVPTWNSELHSLVVPRPAAVDDGGSGEARNENNTIIDVDKAVQSIQGPPQPSTTSVHQAEVRTVDSVAEDQVVENCDVRTLQTNDSVDDDTAVLEQSEKNQSLLSKIKALNEKLAKKKTRLEEERIRCKQLKEKVDTLTKEKVEAVELLNRFFSPAQLERIMSHTPIHWSPDDLVSAIVLRKLIKCGTPMDEISRLVKSYGSNREGQ